MKIPNKIKIGETDYKINLKNYYFDKKSSGQINFSDQVILIKKNTSERNLEEAFFHEIAHGILKELEMNHPTISGFTRNELFAQEMGLMLRKSFLDLLKEQGVKLK